MWPEAWEEEVAEGVVVAGDEDIAGFGAGEGGVSEIRVDAFGGAGFFDAGLAEFCDGAAGGFEEAEHDLSPCGAVAAEEGEPAVGEEAFEGIAAAAFDAGFFGDQDGDEG